MQNKKMNTQGEEEGRCSSSKAMSIGGLKSEGVRNEQQKMVQSASHTSASKSWAQVNCERNKSSSLKDAKEKAKPCIEIGTSSIIYDVKPVKNPVSGTPNASKCSATSTEKLSRPCLGKDINPVYINAKPTTSSSCETTNASTNVSLTTGKLTEPHSRTENVPSVASDKPLTARNFDNHTPLTPKSLPTSSQKLASSHSDIKNAAISKVVQVGMIPSPGICATNVGEVPKNESVKGSHAVDHQATPRSRTIAIGSNSSVSDAETSSHSICCAASASLPLQSQRKLKNSPAKLSEQKTQSDKSKQEEKRSMCLKTNQPCGSSCQHCTRKPLKVIALWEKTLPSQRDLR